MTPSAPNNWGLGETMDLFEKVDEVIRSHLADLRIPGVLTVRPGFRFANGWITRDPAVVMTVDADADGRAIPARVGPYPTDVRRASAAELLRRSDPRGFADALGAAPPRLRPAYFPLEREVATGALVPRPRAAAKPTVPYTPAPGATLAPVRDRMSLTCSASPDSGWMVLSGFLAVVRQALTVGMYDFTSGHVLAGVKAALTGSGRTLSLVLDDPPGNPAGDQTDDEAAAALAQLLGGAESFAWAAEAQDPHVAQAIFPNAYHIKVAVRDHEAFWLSSGNWNNTNQPVIDPWGDPAGAAAIAAKSDRDWHVIVEHSGLARTFEAYLLHDLAVAKGLQAARPRDRVALPLALFAPQAKVPPTAPPRQFYRPLQIVDQVIAVQPVLTPDVGVGNYAEGLLELIESAAERLYIQTQYVHPPLSGEDPAFATLVAAVASKMKAGLDVRVILSEYETAAYLEQLQAAGWDMSAVRIQRGVHNKGFVVDSQAVAVGSQNWSGDGVLRNRDATVVVRDAQAAQYFERIFLDDWEGQARQQV